MSTRAKVDRLTAEIESLGVRHKKAKDVEYFARYADDPSGFFRDVLKCEPWSRQIEMAESVRDFQKTAIVTANGIGKDWISARIALWWVYARKGFSILTGPTDRQVSQICMRELRQAFKRAPELPGELLARELRVDESGECGLLAFTSDNADRLVGYHHPRLLIQITEGQGVEEEAYEAALACVTSPENRLYVYGNPTRTTGRFPRIAESESWNVLTIAATEHPNVVSGREEIPGAVSREWISSVREEYGEASSIYRSRVLSLFPEEAAEGLIRKAWLRASYERYKNESIDASIDRVNNPPRAILALDVARYGADVSCLCVLRGDRMEPLITWRDKSITESAHELMRYAERYSIGTNQPHLVVDETGLGAGVVDVVRDEGWLVTGFNGSAAPSDSERFLNLRAESHWQLRNLLERNEVDLIEDSILEEEALAIEWQLTGSGVVQILGKELVKKAIGRSPDRLDAVVMAFWHLHAPKQVWGVSEWRGGYDTRVLKANSTKTNRRTV